MEYRRLGASGPVVSRVAFGNSLTAGNQLDDRAASACVRAALDAGITTFDTADAYAEGRAEEHLGRALAGVDRDAVVICTKVGRGGGPGPGRCRGPVSPRAWTPRCAASAPGTSTCTRRTCTTTRRRSKRP